MPFVKLDCGVLDSTLWVNRDQRDMFITALLMAVPFELEHETAQLAVRTLEATGYTIPPGWYGFVPAAGSGIARRALIEPDAGLDALVVLSNPDPESRTPDHEGRRLARIDGGYLVLNFMLYRDKDTSAADRMRRYRTRQRTRNTYKDGLPVTRNGVTVTRNGDSNVTIAYGHTEHTEHTESTCDADTASLFDGGTPSPTTSATHSATHGNGKRPKRQAAKPAKAAKPAEPPPPSAPPPATRTTWLTPASVVYEAKYGAGTFPFPLAGRAFKPLVAAGVTPEDIATHLGRYVEATEPQFVNLGKFAQTFAAWDDPGPLVDPETGLLTERGAAILRG